MEAKNDDDEVTPFTLWLEFENWTHESGHDPEDDFFNMKVGLASGRCYALTVWTFRFLERVVHSIRFEKPVQQDLPRLGFLVPQHHLEREYLEPPDLLVTRLDRKLIEEIIMHLLRKYDGQLLPQWECSPPLALE